MTTPNRSSQSPMAPTKAVPGSVAIAAGSAVTLIVFLVLAGGLAAVIVGGLFSAQEEAGPDEMPPALSSPGDGIPPDAHPKDEPTIEGAIPEASTPTVPDDAGLER